MRANRCVRIGGDEEIRTPDPLLARQVLSQLSYTPIRDENQPRLIFRSRPKTRKCEMIDKDVIIHRTP